MQNEYFKKERYDMPPKPKFTREEITAAALRVISRNGITALTAQTLGQELGSSARPIFTVFKTMEEVRQEAKTAAMHQFEGFAEKAVHYMPAFKQFGMQMILFALEEPHLYQLLFMQGDGRPHSFEEVFAGLGEPAGVCLDILQREYGLVETEAMALFRHVWIYTYGIATLCATGMCRFSEEEINDLLGQDFMAMLVRVKSGGLNQQTPHPMPKS